MDDRFSRGRVLTVPNLLSLIRIALIPLIIRAYRDSAADKAALLVLLSGLTDLADGYIARRFRCVSDIGKILDPVADKLTIGALILCLASRYRNMVWLLALFAGKELFMAVIGVIVIHRMDMVNSAQWFGKLSTLALYAMGLILFLAPSVPEWAVNGMMLLCGGLILVSLLKYMSFYRKLLKGC